MDDVPENLQVHALVVVDQLVSKACNLGPLDLIVLAPEFRRDLLDGFADHSEIAGNRVLLLSVPM